MSFVSRFQRDLLNVNILGDVLIMFEYTIVQCRNVELERTFRCN